jgi:hypothetical protein
MINQLIKIKGKTKHGKTRIRENGEIFRITGIQPHPDRIQITSLKTGYIRWITIHGEDKHVEIISTNIT